MQNVRLWRDWRKVMIEQYGLAIFHSIGIFSAAFFDCPVFHF